jgi:hypothetical protein
VRIDINCPRNAPCCSLLTALLTAHCSLHCSLHNAHCNAHHTALLTAHCSPQCTAHYAALLTTLHCSLSQRKLPPSGDYSDRSHPARARTALGALHSSVMKRVPVYWNEFLHTDTLLQVSGRAFCGQCPPPASTGTLPCDNHTAVCGSARHDICFALAV